MEGHYSRGYSLVFEGALAAFPFGPVEVQVPGTVRQHFLPGIKPRNPRTRLIAVCDATLGNCQDSAGNILVEQYAITFPAKLRFS
jgi:hypothetical protein